MNSNFSFSNYKIIRKIGEGGFGEISLIEKESKFYALKKSKYKLKEEELKELNKILNIVSQINNEYIIKYYDKFTENGIFNIIMEYGGDYNLKQFIKNQVRQLFDEKLILEIILQICKGLREIHKYGRVHRDLTPDNIFIDKNNKIKIGDFGISIILTTNKRYTKSIIGKYKYFAPEIEKGENYNHKVDIYSLGCLIYELLTLNEYYIDKKVEEKQCKINIDVYNPKWQELIDLLLKKDYHERPDVEEVLNKVKVIEKEIKNEIRLEVKVNKIDIYKEVYFLTPFKNIGEFNPLMEMNEYNTELFINEKQEKFKRFFVPTKEGIYSIKIKLHFPMKDCSFMFYGCDNLESIDLSFFDTKNVINMKCMFTFCINVKSIDLSLFETKNVINMENMFYLCKNLKNLDLSSFDTKNVANIKGLIELCNCLKEVKVKKQFFHGYEDSRLIFVD